MADSTTHKEAPINGWSQPRSWANTTLPKEKSCGLSLAVLSTFLIASTVGGYTAPNDQSKFFPTAHTIPSIPPFPIRSSEELFQFEDRDLVLSYLENNDGVSNFLKSLPFMIKSIFGNANLRLSVFQDYEENWSSLRVEIESSHDIEELSELENQLFKVIESDSSFVAALDHVIISCG